MITRRVVLTGLITAPMIMRVAPIMRLKVYTEEDFVYMRAKRMLDDFDKALLELLQRLDNGLLNGLTFRTSKGLMQYTDSGLRMLDHGEESGFVEPGLPGIRPELAAELRGALLRTDD
jgi:hypothetical protein